MRRPPWWYSPRLWKDDVVNPTDTVVLLAVVRGFRLYGELMEATGLPRRTLKDALDRLRARGFVTWDAGKTGTLRPLVKVR